MKLNDASLIFLLPQEQKDFVKEIAYRKRINVSEYLRRLIELEMENNKNVVECVKRMENM